MVIRLLLARRSVAAPTTAVPSAGARMRSDAGLSLTEMLLVTALLGIVITVIFGAVQVLAKSAASTTDNGTASNDLSYTMTVVSKSLMDSRVLYANDNRIVVLNTLADGSHVVQSIYASGTPGADGLGAQLISEKWESDASGTVPVGSAHSVWVMSERNSNLSTSAPRPLFSYFKDSTDASLMSVASGDKASAPDASLSAFVGVLPGGYTPSAIGRIRLRVASQFAEGVRDDSRDITLRIRG